MSRMFFFGYGYVAAALAKRLKAEGWEMAGTTRTPEKANQMWKDGVEPYVWDGKGKLEAPLRVMKGVTHILHSIPPTKDGDAVMQNHSKLMVKIAPQLQWYGYLSTTGVYGFTPDGLVDETYEPNPETPNGKLRLRVERTHMQLFKKAKAPMHIFRLGAIYGPERGIFERVRRGQEHYVDKEDHMVNRIYIDDLVSALWASIKNPNPGRIYNLVDDEPSNSVDPVMYASKLLGRTPPTPVPYEQAQENLSAAMKAHFNVSRHISNKRMREELGVAPKYPSYREGFDQIYKQLQEQGAA